MNICKKIGEAILFPRTVVFILLIPVAAILLGYSFFVLSEDDPIRVVCYLFSFYTLVVVCFRIPRMIQFFRHIRKNNKYLALLHINVRLRVRLSLYGTFFCNAAYGVFQLCLGIYHASLWYYAMAAYYILLAVMRFSLLRCINDSHPVEGMDTELKKYRFCGIVLLLMNLVLAAIVFFLIYENREFRHHEITVIAMAAYTFFSLTTAILNTVKYHKYQSPVFSAAKAIGLVCACVSILTLENAMFAVFGMPGEEMFRQIMISATGGVIFAFIFGMAVYMTVSATKRLRSLGNS